MEENKEVTVIGLNEDMKYACILSVGGIDWEWLKANSHIAHIINFRHSCTSWGGRDTLDDTLKSKRLSLTGEEIRLEKPITLHGNDYDMGHNYSWSFDVHYLLRCAPINKGVGNRAIRRQEETK